MNTNLLKGRMLEQGYTVKTLAPKLGMTENKLYYQLSTGRITVDDAVNYSRVLKLNNKDKLDIFFTHKSNDNLPTTERQ